MKVQKVIQGNKTFYLLLGNNYERLPEVDKWVQFLLAKDASPNTIRTYMYNLMPFYEFMAGYGVKPLEIDSDGDSAKANRIIMEFISHLNDPAGSMTAVNGKAPKARTNENINSILTTVSNFYETMRLLDLYDGPMKFTKTVRASKYMTGNPLAELFFGGKTTEKNIYLRPVVQKPVKYILRDQYTELFFALNNERDRLIAAIMFECGLRVSEALGLRWEDLDELENNTVKVVFRDDNLNGARAKYREERSVPAPDYVVDMIVSHELALQEHESRDHVIVPHGFVFSGKRRGLDKPLGYDAVYNSFARASEKLGWEATPHMLRHGFGNEKAAILQPDQVRMLMGHKHIRTTMNNYIETSALMANPMFRKKMMLSNYGYGGIVIE